MSMSKKVNKNANTHTSTSRRTKAKGQKMTLGEFNAQLETPVEPKPVEVQVETQPIAEPKPVETQPEQTQPVETQPVETPTPVVNVWEERRKKAADEALKAADEALKAAKAAKKEAEALASMVKTRVETKPKPKTKSDEEFVKVGPKGKPVRKNQPRPAGNQNNKPSRQDDQKSRTVRYEPTEKQKAARLRKGNALEQARTQMIEECVLMMSNKDIDSINTGIQYVVNFHKTLVLDLFEDALVVEIEGDKFQFSRIQFLENRTFQYKARERFAQFLPDAWVKFFHGRKEGTFCIGLTRDRRQTKTRNNK